MANPLRIGWGDMTKSDSQTLIIPGVSFGFWKFETWLCCRLVSSVWLACMLSLIWLFATLWTVVCQAPLSMGFSRQKNWSMFPRAMSCSRKFFWPRDQICVSVSPALTGGFFTNEPPGNPKLFCSFQQIVSWQIGFWWNHFQGHDLEPSFLPNTGPLPPTLALSKSPIPGSGIDKLFLILVYSPGLRSQLTPGQNQPPQGHQSTCLTDLRPSKLLFIRSYHLSSLRIIVSVFLKVLCCF